MATIESCIAGLRRAGRLGPQAELELREWIRNAERSMPADITPGMQRKIAAQIHAIQGRLRENRLARRQAELSAIAYARNHAQALAHPKGYRRGYNTVLAQADLRRRVWQGKLEGMMADAISAFRTRNLGFSQNTDLIERAFRQLHGTDTGDAEAKSLAKSISEMAEYARQAFNRAGGDIRYLWDWGSPQFHDSRLVGRVSRQEWTGFVEQLLDRDKMLGADGLPLSDLEWRTTLDEVYETIRTDGLNKIRSGTAPPQGTKLANRHRDPRFLKFKNGDAWVTYQKRFGKPDLWGGLMGHVDRMAQEIALLETMGPNPAHAHRAMMLNVRKAMTGGKVGPEGARVQYTEALWKVVSGAQNETPSGWIHEVFATARQALVASKLGSAMISALADTALTKMASDFYAMPSMRVYRRALSLMNPANEADRVRALRMNLGAEALGGRSPMARRFGEEIPGSSRVAQTAEATLRASGLSTWTDGVRKAIGMELMGWLAEHSGVTWRRLNPTLRRGLETAGIAAEDWELMRQAPQLYFDDPSGVRAGYLVADNLVTAEIKGTTRRQRENVAMKFQQMIMREQDMASPMPDARARAFMTMGSEAGTITGELMRSFFLFKGFPVTMLILHGSRALNLPTKADTATYLAKLAVLTTLGGAVALQAKQIIRGKDARPMDTPQFWGAAMVQGGGAGLIGDFLYSDVNRFNKGFFHTMAGPVFDLGDDAVALTWGNARNLMAGEPTNFASELTRFASLYAPGSSLWYTRLLMERYLIDNAQKLADPQAHRKWTSQARRMSQDYGQRYWWPRGRSAPARAPRLKGG